MPQMVLNAINYLLTRVNVACSEIDYLGHMISAEGVRADGKKLSAIVEWPRPKSLRGFKGFHGLTGYYRIFIKGYGTIAAPLTDLLKKNTFLWSEVTDQAFQNLKIAITNPPMLVLPNFNQPFVIECDALMEGNWGSANAKSKANCFFQSSSQGKKWRPYVLGHPLIIKTDHQSLKYL